MLCSKEASTVAAVSFVLSRAQLPQQNLTFTYLWSRNFEGPQEPPRCQ